MNKALALAAATSAIAAGIFAGSADAAGVNRIWVSGHGVDQAGCGAPTAPCRSLQYAHDNIASGGEIDILDPAGYGAITITKSISIVNDGVGTAGVQTSSGIAINITAGAADSIYLRGLNIDGVGFTGSTGVQFNTGAKLTIANCVVRHFVNYGIALAPSSANVRIGIDDTVSSDNHGGGIAVRPISSSDAKVIIDGVTAQGNGGGLEGDGITVDGGSTTGSTGVYISNTNAGNNLGDGLLIENASTASTSVSIDRSEFDANTRGIDGEGKTAIFLSNSSMFGNSDIDRFSGGATGSAFIVFGNNMANSSEGDNFTHQQPF